MEMAFFYLLWPGTLGHLKLEQKARGLTQCSVPKGRVDAYKESSLVWWHWLLRRLGLEHWQA